MAKLESYVQLINRGGDHCGMGLASDYPDVHAEVDGETRANDTEWYCREDVDALVKWQPIETAPKDGTLIIAYDGSIGVAVWRMLLRGGAWWTEDNFQWKPTHWMPLPQPPAT